jgi:methionine-rich copper-binding protein CopC
VLRLHRALATGAVTAVMLVAGLALASPADAHAEVVSTSPAAGSTVHKTLTEVSVTFDEAVTLVPHAIRVTTDLGIPVALETPRLAKGTVLSAQVQDHLAPGRYLVAWRIQADDGHLESSTFTFSVADAGVSPSGAAPTAAAPPASPGEPLWPVLVAAGLALAGGLGAGAAVRHGLRLAATGERLPDDYSASPGQHETLRLPM